MAHSLGGGRLDAEAIGADETPNIQRYSGVRDAEEEQIRELARKLTNTSSVGNRSETPGSVAAETNCDSLFTTGEGINPIARGPESVGYNPRLDPSSEEFSSRAWVKNLSKIHASDPEYYKPYSLGCAWKDLTAWGAASDLEVQSTVVTSISERGKEYLRKVGGLFNSSRKEKGAFQILHSMDGLLLPSELLVVLGRPGAGCTSFLKTIASDYHGFSVGEDTKISYDGLTPKDIVSTYRGEVVYNAEMDVHVPRLTVYQTLNTVALLSAPANRLKGVDVETYAQHVTDVTMATYGLSHTRDTIVGNSLIRGVSGGERKRVSIAEVSICGSKFQCWDNATRGLDSATALEFVRALRTNADLSDAAAAVSIYQCSQETYDLFDKVSVIYEGYQIYFGPTSKAKQYFTDMGYSCPQRQTTADFLTAVTSPAERIPREDMVGRMYIPSTPKEMAEYWRQSPEYHTLIANIDSYLDTHSNSQERVHYMKEVKGARKSKHASSKSPYLLSYATQVKYLTRRNVQRLKAELSITLFQIFGNIIMAIILGSMFYKVLKGTTASTFYFKGSAMFFGLLFNAFASFLEVYAIFDIRPVTEKHRRYGLYHPSAEAIASVVSEIPSKVLVSIVFNLIFYFLCHLRKEAGAFFFFFLMGILSTFSMSHLFRSVGAASKTLGQSMVSASILLLVLATYVGFAVPKTKLLGWSKWLYYINPLSYVFESIMVNEFHGRRYLCDQYIPFGPGYDETAETDAAIRACKVVGSVAGESYVSGDAYLSLSYQYEHRHKWRSLGINIAYIIFFLGVYLLLSEYNESAKQKGEVLVYPRHTIKEMKKKQKYLSTNNDEESNLALNRTKESALVLKDDEKGSNGSDYGNSGIMSSKAVFHWRNVCYDVKIGKETRRILDHVDGWVKPGTVTALMGSSGAGKTTLLDCLASRVSTGVLTGDMFVNGHLRGKSFPRSIGYCQQQDLHLPTSSVREALQFSAYLRQPRSVSKQEKDGYVETVIKILEMEAYADAVIGVAGEGLNVEQRKRLTIGVELVAKPKLLLFLDEPTSGLDSQTAWSICQLIRKLADNGQAVLCTIHQPSAILMQEFDRLLLLQRGGQTVYFGELGEGCCEMINYFESHCSEKCPKDANPAEWMLRVIGAAPGAHTTVDYHAIWRNSSHYKQVQNELDYMEKELSKTPLDTNDEDSAYSATFLQQLYTVTLRAFQQDWRSPMYIWSKLFLSITSSLFLGFTFYKSDLSIQGLQNQMLSIFMMLIIFNPLVNQYLPVFVQQREIYETKERASRTFSWKVFLLSQIIVEIPWNILAGTLAFLCYYYPIGLNANASAAGQLSGRGFFFWLLYTTFYVYTGSVALALMTAFEYEQNAGNLGSLLLTMSVSFCGVLVTSEKLPRFWIFMYRISPFTYVVDALLSSGLANVKVSCSDYELLHFKSPVGQSCADYLSSYFSRAGGYLATTSKLDDGREYCGVCPISDTNAFLKGVGSNYDNRWRNYGIFFAYIVFNYSVALLVYYKTRVPKDKYDVSAPKNKQQKEN